MELKQYAAEHIIENGKHYPEKWVNRYFIEVADAQRALDALQAQLARWKEALGEWLWNCTNLLGDYHIKTVQDFNEEVNRRIAWLMQHLDHTLPPPMTDEERDRMRKLSEDNAALQADNECKDSLIETLQAQAKQLDRTLADVYQQRDGLQAQLRQVEGERDAAQALVSERASAIIKDTKNMLDVATRSLREELTQLQALVRALIYSDNAPEHDRAWFALRATLAAQDAPHPTEEQS